MDMPFAQFHMQILDPERIPYAIIAVLLTILAGVVTGPLAGSANPFIWSLVDILFGGFGDRLDKTHRSRGDLVFRGFLMTVLVLFCALIIGYFFHGFVEKYTFYGLIEPLLLSFMLTAGSVWFVLLRLYFALEKNSVGQGAYYAISRSMRRNLNAGDDFGITRAGMGFAARSFDKGLVNPVFWYLLGGLPLALVYTAMAGLAWRFGKDGFTKGFGAVPLALERLLGFFPSLYAAALISAASIFTPTAGIARSVIAWAGLNNRAPYEQGGYPLSALAWALNISLGGASQDLGGSAIKGEWVGPEGATAQLDHKHLRRALYMSLIAHFLFLLSLGSAFIWAGL